MWAKYYIDRSTLASIDVVIPSLYVTWLGFQITRVQIEIQV